MFATAVPLVAGPAAELEVLATVGIPAAEMFGSLAGAAIAAVARAAFAAVAYAAAVAGAASAVVSGAGFEAVEPEVPVGKK